ncbi:hypothetical protein Mal15_12960 [Stieleria maiorica]|uniref:Uncharacterized protein n=1 Tax=Stieleria maiorica TaxID=2795974 RepID=A0A5B9MDD0_9BACT|nr:hypothetical protein [Stieleria maiorica]QEF97257.1 hypothetical protein Mal15_12960 [Stieleria maiorica]
MNPDELDRLIRRSDPATDARRSDAADPLLRASERQWAGLAARRIIIRKRLTLSLAAMGLFVILGGTLQWVAMKSTTTSSHLAAVDAPVNEKAIPAHDADAAANSQAASIDAATAAASDQTKLADAAMSDGAASGERLEPAVPPKRTVPDEDARQLVQFAAFIDRAGEFESDTWHQSCDFLARQDARSQRAAIALVPKLVAPQRRERAFELVCAAAAESKRNVMRHWLAQPSLRALAFDRLASDASLRQAIELLPLALTDAERMLLCRTLAVTPEPDGADLLLELAHDPVWRSAVAAAARELHPSHIQSLILRMRERNVPARTAAAFLLASVPGNQLDQVLASMILRGRFQQPAYLALLSRNTPQAKAFLAQAANRRDLSAALVSARVHFATIQPTLQQWIADSKGPHHEQSETLQRRLPELLAGRHDDRRRCAGLPDAGAPVG